jgi:adenosylhomocysteine nucleosidase
VALSGSKHRCRLLSVIGGFVLSLLFTGGRPSAAAAEDPQPYLILYAFSEEGELIGQNMSASHAEEHLGRAVLLGELSGKSVVLAELGIGMTNAAMTTQRMIDVYTPQAVIATGIAGSIDSSVDIGDIVVCRTWVTHDYGYIGSGGFEPGGVPVSLPGAAETETVWTFDVDSTMLAVATTLSRSDLDVDSLGERVPQLLTGGVGVTGNSFIDSKEKRLWLSEQFQALITDMESAAVAQVCAVNGLPFIAFRSASDLAGGSGSETARDELDEFFTIAADNSSAVVLQFIGAL